ncbi:sodium-translocating pyrophosphatase [Candidatus Bipolaricaulota bacterium]|nr:sodium-translocating pyrophosphatase [Candidatus Bipolaricaulota bacterium]
MLGAAALVSVAALAWSAYATYWVARRDPGTERMREIQGYIREGAWAFMLAEARVMAITLAVVGAVLWALFYWEVAVAFWVGSGLAMAAGFIGMNAATLANARTTHAARTSFKQALNVAFSGGSVMGMAVAGLAVGGLALVIWLFRREFDPGILYIHTKTIFGIPGADVNFIKGALIVSAYSAGASLVALFDRVGGGIYTKAADMAADLVGKVELKIPEDDPRNPATIADNVGDNVGDVGGLGADLLESFVGAVISAIVISLYIYVGRGNPDIQGLLAKFGLGENITQDFWWFALLPILYVTGGIVACLIAIAYIRFSRREQGTQGILMNGTRLGALLTAGFAALFTWLSPLNFVPFYAAILGIVSGIAIGFVSEYYTSSRYKPTRDLAKAYQSGAAVGVTEGMAVGMMSALWPCLIIAVATVVAYQMGGLLAVAYAALGMLSFVGMTVSVDSYGPIGDNAAGIATMAKLDPSVRERTDQLDAIGNTTAAIGKGFAIGSAAFAALGLIAAYLWSAAGRADEVHVPDIPIINPTVGGMVVAGLIVGAMVTYVFSALLIRAVSRTADVMVQEIRRQFRDNPKIMSGEESPDYRRCITITAHGGVRRMVLPSLLALGMPLFVGLLFGRYTLAGFLVGALLSAIMLAIYCGNAGGAMDNAKKYVEEGHFGGKGSEAHAAGVIADTVGDPLKDTVGPSLDILIKLMSVISLLFASLFPVIPFFMR